MLGAGHSAPGVSDLRLDDRLRYAHRFSWFSLHDGEVNSGVRCGCVRLNQSTRQGHRGRTGVLYMIDFASCFDWCRHYMLGGLQPQERRTSDGPAAAPASTLFGPEAVIGFDPTQAGQRT